MRTVVLFLFVILLKSHAFADSRFSHNHDDLFCEDAILFGFKLGPQVTRYTSVQNRATLLTIRGGTRAVGGAALKFVYGLPRIEFDLFWNVRGGLNTGESLYAISLPVSVKFPIDLGNSVDLELGGGAQPDLVAFEPGPHRQWLYGAFGTAGISVDYTDFVFDFEIRYNVGIKNLAEEIVGGRPIDLQILGGILWIF